MAMPTGTRNIMSVNSAMNPKAATASVLMKLVSFDRVGLGGGDGLGP